MIKERVEPVDQLGLVVDGDRLRGNDDVRPMIDVLRWELKRQERRDVVVLRLAEIQSRRVDMDSQRRVQRSVERDLQLSGGNERERATLDRQALFTNNVIHNCWDDELESAFRS